eukprot:TRINITY_DN67058_c0_g1_i1.p1 TRINITY_DN67058_c0_g1~~TRINITY_DN67058_c0_g1_i1.p1  ORF type:complete len:311 (+),score=76.55 TRINITY_DN67058_c0_g1_i1:70-933(+)
MVLRLLTVAGSDSGGGAGIQADLKTFAAHECYGMSVITAVTAQNTIGVHGVYPLAVEAVQSQLEEVLSDIGCDALKTGMLATPQLVATVSESIREHKIRHVVVDPVFAASTGELLLDPDAVDSVRENLLPLASVITPNVDEAKALLGCQLRSVDDMHRAARELHELGPACVIVKGGDLAAGGPDAADSVDVFYDGKRLAELRLPRLKLRRHAHGTGCTFASAVAVGLARGWDTLKAATAAKEYVHGALSASMSEDWQKLGSGPQGPINHLWCLQPREPQVAEVRWTT